MATANILSFSHHGTWAACFGVDCRGIFIDMKKLTWLLTYLNIMWADTCYDASKMCSNWIM